MARRSNVSTLDITNKDGSKTKVTFVDAPTRARLNDLRASIAATSAKLDTGGGGGGTDTPTPDVPSVDTAIAAIDAAWGTDTVWSTLAQYGDTVRANPEAFSKYVGQTLTYTHASYGSQQVRCVDVAHFDRSDGTGKAAFVFDHVAIPYKRSMNSTNTTSGGYPASEMKTFLEGTKFYGGIPENIRNLISSVTIPCSLTQGATPTDTPNCTLFLLSEKEVFGTNVNANEGTQLAWYASNNNNISRVKNYNGSSDDWWLRSPGSSTRFAYVRYGGALDSYSASGAYGVCPGFNIG